MAAQFAGLFFIGPPPPFGQHLQSPRPTHLLSLPPHSAGAAGAENPVREQGADGAAVAAGGERDDAVSERVGG